MPDRSMTPQEIAAYLKEPRLANLATLKGDGSPHVAPVWYEYDGETVYIIAGKSAVKTRNINRDPRVAISIAGPEEPYKYVLIEGKAEVTTRNVEKVTLSICIRYRGQDRGSRFAGELLAGGNTVTILVHPDRIITWVAEEGD